MSATAKPLNALLFASIANLLSDPIEGIGVRAGPPGLAAVERGDLVDLLSSELEVEQREVLAHPRRRRRLREHDASTLDVPAQRDLRRRSVDGLRDLRDNRV